MTTATLKKPKTTKKCSGLTDLVGNDICQICGYCCKWKLYGNIVYYYDYEIADIQKRNKRCYKYIMKQIRNAVNIIDTKNRADGIHNRLTKSIIQATKNDKFNWVRNRTICGLNVWSKITDLLRNIEGTSCKDLVVKNGKYYCNIHSKFGYKNKSNTCKLYKCTVFREAEDYKNNYITLIQFKQCCKEFIKNRKLKKKLTVEQLVIALS